MSRNRDQIKSLMFIEDYKSCVALWDSNHKDYSRQSKRNDALECLAITHSMSIAEVKNKIKCLRSYFSKEHQKVAENKSDEDYEPSWFAYEPMKFILVSKATKDNKAVENDDFQNYQNEAHATADDDREFRKAARRKLALKRNREIEKEIEHYQTDVHITHVTAEDDNESIRKARRKLNLNRMRENEKELEIHHFPKISPVDPAKSPLPIGDEFSIFGQMVASQIRKLGRRNQAIAKNTIQNFLFDLEMREMESAEENPELTEVVVQTLSPNSPPQILKNTNSVYSDYAVACKKIEDLVTFK